MKPFFTFWRFLLLNCFALVLSVSPAHAQWQQISSPDGGLIKSIFQYNSMYFVRTPNGIYRSTDNAQTWQNTNLNVPYRYDFTPVMSFASSDNRLYAGTSIGIYVSTDSGRSWSSEGTGDDPDFLVAQDSVLICANYSYGISPSSVIRRSANYGATWTKLKLESIHFAQVTGLALTPTSVLLTTADHGMLRSTDQGKTWDTLTNTIATEPLSSLTADGSIYYAGTSYGKVFKSMNNGDTWQEIAATSTKYPVTSILAHGNLLFYSTMGGGLFKSTDTGTSWKECTTGPMNNWIYSVVGSPPNLLAYSDQGDGVFRSTNSGETWEVANKGINAHQILHIYADVDTLYSYTSSSMLYQSTDRSASWKKLFTTLPADALISCFRRRGNTVFVGTSNKGVFRSRDNGEHWEAIGKELATQSIVSMSLYTTSLSIIGEGAAIYVSTDDGESWTDSSPGVDYVTGPIYIHENIILAHPYISLNGGQSWQFDSLERNTKCIVELDSNLYAGTPAGLYKSINHGISWKFVGLKYREVYSIAKSSTTIYALIKDQNFGSSTNLAYSIDDGTTWQSFETPSSIFSYEVAVLGSTLYLGTQSGIYSVVDTTLYSRDWYPSAVQNEYVRSITSIDSTIFVGIEEKGVMKSLSYVRQWVYVNTGLENLFVKKLISNGSILVAGTAGGVYISRDKGEHWTTSSSIVSNKNVISLEWKGSLLFAGTSTGGIYRSSDSSATWTQVYTGSPTNTIWTIATTGTTLFTGTNSGILRSVDNGNHWDTIIVGKSGSAVYGIYATSSMILVGTDYYGIYKSTDNGNTWTESSAGLTTKQIRTFSANKRAIFVGTVSGVCSSTDDGASWNAFGLDELYITALHATTPALYAGTPGSGSLNNTMNNTSIWRVLLSQPTTVEEMPITSQELSGLLCYPNPATSSLTIDYGSLPFSLSVPIECTITSVTGEVIRIFELHETRTTLPMENFASGVYMITLRQGLQRSSTLFSILH